MQPDHIESLFGALRTLDPQRREAQLVALRESDPSSAAEVEALLQLASKAEGFLAREPDGVLTQRQNVPTLVAGQQLGRFRVAAQLGSGGMGSVYLAERADGEYEQMVALKVVREDLGDSMLVERFNIERRILARLQHPFIARLLDGGTDACGQPYLVMEYVEGEPIDQYCNQRGLEITERLQLFCAVCKAVQYAHQNLIVHRDLKPSNILVTAEGMPKLLDFGIAKLLAPDTEEFGFDTLSMAPMTPDFAAPEQVSGGPITTATDVYALGIVLYLLLANCRPYSNNRSDLAAFVRSLCETEVSPPSEVAPSHLRQMLRGDLDNIVLRALQKEPQRRYSSAQQLADDIEAWLNGQPVLASRPTRRYRLLKFIRRNRLAVSVSSFALIALLATTGLAGWQWQIAREQRERAEQRFAEQRELTNTLVFEFPRIVETLPGATEARKRLLETGLAYLDKLAADRRDEPQLQRELATAYSKLATVQGLPIQPNLGDARGAIASYSKALRLREALLSVVNNDAGLAVEVAETYQNLSAVQGFLGELGKADELIERCITLLEPRLAHGQRPVLEKLLGCTTVAAHWKTALGQYDASERRLRQALSLYALKPNDTASRQLGRIQEEQAAAAAGRGKNDEALAFERHRLELALTEPSLEWRSRRLADAYHGLAARLAANGQTDEALKTYDLALAQWQDRARADQSDTRPQQALAGIYADLAALHFSLTDDERKTASTKAVPHKQAACTFYQRSLDYLERLPERELGLGARYPWLSRTFDSLKSHASVCAS